MDPRDAPDPYLEDAREEIRREQRRHRGPEEEPTYCQLCGHEVRAGTENHERCERLEGLGIDPELLEGMGTDMLPYE